MKSANDENPRNQIASDPMKRRIGLLAVFVLCSSCYSWRRTDIPEPISGEAWVIDHPTRVDLRAGPESRFERVHVAGDTLFGTDSKNQRVLIALSDVRAIRARRFSTLRTATAVAATGAAVFLYLGLRELFALGAPTS